MGIILGIIGIIQFHYIGFDAILTSVNLLLTHAALQN